MKFDEQSLVRAGRILAEQNCVGMFVIFATVKNISHCTVKFKCVPDNELCNKRTVRQLQ